MSKWGHVSKTAAKMKFENQPDDAASMVCDMSAKIIEHEKSIYDLKDQIISLQTDLVFSKAAEAHLKGYVERVKDLDPKPKTKRS